MEMDNVDYIIVMSLRKGEVMFQATFVNISSKG